MAYRLLGQNFVPPDLLAKVTGTAKYAEDFRADGMLFVKMLTSPMPHGRVRHLDTSAAEAMEGVVAVLTADEVPQPKPPGEEMLTNEPKYIGQPILAVAATDEWIAAEALDRIKIDLQPLPFVIDPLDSLYPGGPNARLDGNVTGGGIDLTEVKWTARDFAAAGDDKLPMGKPADEWSYGDIQAGFKQSDVIIEESFVTAGYTHQSMETRSAMAYWVGDKCHLFASTQSSAFSFPGAAATVGVTPDKLVYITEFCGGGFGSKGGANPFMGIPAYMSKKTGKPCMMRIARQEEHGIGSARSGFQAYARLGFRKDGRLLAADVYCVSGNGPASGFPDWRNFGETICVLYQPENMRWRGIPVLTNTPPSGAQRGPGENQTSAAMEPLIDEAARQLKMDRVEIRKVNAPTTENGKFGPDREKLTSARLVEALDIGAKEFNWAEKSKRSGERNGPKVIGVGVGQAFHTAGSNGFDGLVVITPDGKLHIHNGAGNLGTYSYAGTSRVAAEVLELSWDDCVIHHGDSTQGLPWTLGQFGSNTSFTTSRAVYAGASDAKQKLLELAAMEMGGQPEDYRLHDGEVHSVTDESGTLFRSFAQLAQKAVALGGKYDGHTVNDNLNPLTKAAVAGLAGTGLVGAAKDTLPRKGVVPALAAGYCMVEVDTETGRVKILDYHGVADCGTVIHPQGLHAQIRSGAVWGFGMAMTERHIYDPQNGLTGTSDYYQQKPMTYLDLPDNFMGASAVDMPDAQHPVGTKGIGEPIMGAAAASLICAISDALGGHLFLRTPIVPDMIINAAAGRPQSYKPLQVNCQ